MKSLLEATRILALRHGETAWNASGRIQGQLDIDLNPRGRWQAERLAQALADSAAADQPIAAIYSSDLKRAWSTAEPLAAELQLPLIAEPALRERAFGVFEGHTFDEIKAAWPLEAERWRKREPDFAPAEGGESLRAFRERIVDVVQRLAARHAGAQIALVAHGGVMDVLYRAATRQDIQDVRSWTLHNAAINRLLWTPAGFTLVGWADAQHLADEPSPSDETVARTAHDA